VPFGDSFDVPDDAIVDTLFVPISALWLKTRSAARRRGQSSVGAPRRLVGRDLAVYQDIRREECG
jgi:hypothetical protein